MALNYSPTEIRGKAADPVFSALFFQNKTVGDNLVAFEADVKANTIFTENENTVAVQAYAAGAPTSNGTLGLTDTLITPAKMMVYVEFNPETLRPSRFNQSMASGAWEIMSTEFEQKVLGTYGAQISSEVEDLFWNGILTATTQTTIAGLTADTTTQERAWAAANTKSSQFDGVVAKLITKHVRSYVSGTTLTSSNIATEFGKLYADIAPEALEGAEPVVIYAPKAVKQYINIYNSAATYRDLFSKDGDKYFYNGVEIKFVQLDANVMIAAIPSSIVWCTDLLSDLNYLLIDKIALNRDDMFVKAVFTCDSYIANQKYVSLYIG